MKKYVDCLLTAMIAHAPEQLPLAERYTLLENLHPAAISMTESFRVFQGIRQMGMVFEDKKQNSVLFYCDMDEGGNDTLFYARLGIHNEKIDYLELNIIRSRGDAGFMYRPECCGQIDPAWAKPIPENERASREELERIATEIYMPGMSPTDYEIADDCYLMENGGRVLENPDYAKHMWHTENLVDGENGLVYIPGDIMPLVSKQPTKAWVIDEEQGVVCIWFSVDGYGTAYIESHENSSAFVPEPVIQMHHDNNLPAEKYVGKCVVNDVKTSFLGIEMLRYYGGKIHGQHRLNQLHAIGARFPW